MYCGVVKHDKGVLVDAEGKFVKEADNFVSTARYGGEVRVAG